MRANYHHGERKQVLEARDRSIIRMHRNGSDSVEIAGILGLKRQIVTYVIRRYEHSTSVQGVRL